MDAPPLTAAVTFGGTSEPLDDVRVLSNRSRGRFGAAIVRALLAAGVEVTAIGSEPALAVLRASGPLPPTCRLQAYATTDDLAARLRALESAPPRLLFMAAAVSDYRPRRHPGKLRSDAESLTLELERTPKLLPTLRERLGPETFLVGFKLLSGVSREELVAVATRQAVGSRLDLTVANDLRTFTEREHPVQLVTPDGAAVAVEGAREDVARRVVAFALARCGQAPPPVEAVAAPAHRVEAFRGLAPRGSAAWSVRGGGTWTSAVEDAALFAWLLDALPVRGLLRVPGGLAGPTAEVGASFPPRTLEEGQAVLGTLVEASRGGHDLREGFSVALAGGDLLVGLSEEPSELLGDWQSAMSACRARLDELGVELAPELEPLWDGGRVAGAVARGAGWVAPFVMPAERGRGLGDRVSDLLARRGWRVAAGADDDVGFYLRRGYRLAQRDRAWTVLEPPSLETPARIGASVCLVDVLGRRVLMGRRRVDPWAGRTSFPGGGVEAGESTLAAARRELREETGLEAPANPWFERVVYAGDAEHVLRVHCFAIPCLRVREPTASDEFAGEWVSLDDARRRHLTPSAGCVLDAVERAL